MPGFNINSGGKENPNSRSEPKFSNRWKISGSDLNFWAYLKTASRPSVKFDELKIAYGNETIRFPGKINHDPIKCEIYDVSDPVNVSEEFMKILSDTQSGIYKKIYGNSEDIKENPSSKYKKNIILSCTSYRGFEEENWKLLNCWFNNIEFGKLDYSRDDIITVSFDIVYDRFEYSVDNDVLDGTTPNRNTSTNSSPSLSDGIPDGALPF